MKNRNFFQILIASLLLRCGFCGKGALFTSYLKPVCNCAECGADFNEADAGDGPAIFVMLIVGTICAIILAILEYAYRPSLYFHLAVQFTLASLLTLLLLPVIKALLINLQFLYKAKEVKSSDLQE